jgi:hypothetical protein
MWQSTPMPPCSVSRSKVPREHRYPIFGMNASSVRSPTSSLCAAGGCSNIIYDHPKELFLELPVKTLRAGGAQSNGGALFDTNKRRVCGQAFDMRVDDVVTRCAVEVLRRVGRRISPLPGLPFESERSSDACAPQLSNVVKLQEGC